MVNTGSISSYLLTFSTRTGTLLIAYTLLNCCLSPALHSQDFKVGLIAGVSADGRHLVGGGTDLSPSGWSLGASALFQPVYPFGIRGDAVYSSVNRRFLFSSNGGGDTADLDFNLLNIPIYLRFELKKEGMVPYLYAGTTIGIVLKAIDNNAPDVVSQNVNGELYNVLSASADLGVGVAWPLAKKLGLNLDLRGSWALRGMAPRDLDAWEFDRIGLGAGLFYKIF